MLDCNWLDTRGNQRFIIIKSKSPIPKPKLILIFWKENGCGTFKYRTVSEIIKKYP